MTKQLKRGLAAGAVLCLGVLAGCAGGADHSTELSGAVAGGGRAARASAPLAAPDSAAAAKGGASGVAADYTAPDLVPRAVIKTATVSLRTRHPQTARDGIDGVLARLGGSVETEHSGYDKQGRLRSSSLVLRVPVKSFSDAMTALERLGTVVHASSNSQDVTTQVIDVQQRLETLRISLQDLNGFQRKAAGIVQLLKYENAITQRRGEYQSLKAQRDYLANQTSYSTIRLHITTPPRHVAPAPRHHAGFITGLSRGWHALTVTVLVVLTGIGAGLPFAVLLALVAVPGWWLVRRTLRSRHTGALDPAADTVDPA